MEENSMNSNYETPQSMSFGNTPKRTIIQPHVCTPLQRIKENDVQEEETRVKTPVTINPFEVKADSLYLPSCSPSLFATFAKNKTNNGRFRWSIDHVSVLYPADIDETSVQEVWVDPDHEKQAQIAIDAFFSQNSIVPSPWSSDSKNKRDILFKRTAGESVDVGTQTMLTIPPAIDLLALLGEEFMYKEENDSSCSSSNSSSSSFRECDVMSTSSLRRKLFANDEDCKTPKLERKDLAFAKQWSTPTFSRHSTQSTPSDLLSSSPITPPNCSEFCVIRSSPQMSPIAGPSSHKSFRMRSFIERLDDEGSSQQPEKPCSQDTVSDNCMSFLMDSQDTGTFQSYASERQDTGYNTGSLFSSQNMTTSDTSMGFQSRFAPVAELDDCGFFNTTSNMSTDNFSIITSPVKLKVDSSLYNSEKWSFPPNGCSTPTSRLEKI